MIKRRNALSLGYAFQKKSHVGRRVENKRWIYLLLGISSSLHPLSKTIVWIFYPPFSVFGGIKGHVNRLDVCD